jgi:hypothetical protein
MWQEYSLRVNIFTWQEIHFMENNLIQLNWRNSCISWKHAIYFTNRNVLPIVLYENWVTMWRNTNFLSAFSCGRNIHFIENIPIRRNGETHISPGRITISVRSRSMLTMFSQWELSYHVTRILPVCQHFEVEEICSLCKIALFIYIEETCVSTGRILCMLDAGGS